MKVKKAIGSQTNIAAVDDSQEILDVIKIEFEDDTDYKFKYYSDGNAFLDDLTDDVDLVILDIFMPDFDVVQAVEEIEEVAPMAYIIIISASRDFSQLVKLNNLGIFRFCEKDGEGFIPRLRQYIRAAHRKIAMRKGFLNGNK